MVPARLTANAPLGLHLHTKQTLEKDAAVHPKNGRDSIFVDTTPSPQPEPASTLLSPVSPEFDAVTELPSPMVMGSPPLSMISLSGVPSPRLSQLTQHSPKRSYGALTARPTQINTHNRVVSELDPFHISSSPPFRNFSSPSNEEELVHEGLEREQQQRTVDRSPLTSEIYEGYDDAKNTHRWRYLKHIGKGNFSTVVLGELIDEENPLLSHVAIKIVSLPLHSETRSRLESSLKRELNILRTMDHPSIIKLLSINVRAEKYFIMTPYYQGGDLFELTSRHRDFMSSLLIRKIFAEIATGVCYLHSRNVVHRDIKLENILLNHSPDETLSMTPEKIRTTPLITITDFGLSREIDPANPLLTTRCGSEDYVPPELLIGVPYDARQTDSWALGVLLYAMMEGRLPFDPPPIVASNRMKLKKQSKVAHRIARIEWKWLKFKNDNEDQVWKREDWEPAKYVVENLLVRREKRLTSLDICKHGFVKDLLSNDCKRFMKDI